MSKKKKDKNVRRKAAKAQKETRGRDSEGAAAAAPPIIASAPVVAVPAPLAATPPPPAPPVAEGQVPHLARPTLVGDYQLIQDFQVPSASVRVFRMRGDEQSVEPHLHRHSMQIYVALEGQVRVMRDGVASTLRPYEALAVWPPSIHAASALEGEAVIMNISIPPLAADDQLASLNEVPRDFTLPGAQSDVDD